LIKLALLIALRGEQEGIDLVLVAVALERRQKIVESGEVLRRIGVLRIVLSVK
jgi:hypothetical protein